MSTDTDFRTLWEALHTLRDSMRNLGLTVGQDHPAVPAMPEPVNRAAEEIENLQGLLQEAITAVAPAVSARTQRELRDVVAGLFTCHDRLITIGRESATVLMSPARLEDLAAVATDRGGRWVRWHTSVLDGLDRFEWAMWTSHTAALACWCALATTRPLTAFPVSHTEED